MKTNSKKSLHWAGLTAFLFFFSACGESSGEPCKEDNDCESGLECCPRNKTATQRGTCLSICGEDDN